MKIPPSRFFSVFAVFTTAVFPLVAGIVAAKTFDVYADVAGRLFSGPNAFDNLPPVPDFIFNHFKGLLWALFALSFALTVFNFFQGRIEDGVTRLTRQFTIAIASVFVSLVFLGLFILSFTHLFPPSPY